MSSVVTRRQKREQKIQTRAMIKNEKAPKGQEVVENRRPSAALIEAKKRAREASSKNGATIFVKDIYQNALSSVDVCRGETGIIYDNRMAEHCCLWDQGYPECPERFTRVIERCKELNLLERCRSIEPRPSTLDEILLKHTQEQIDILKATDGDQNLERLEELSSHYDAVYIHPSSFELSKLAVGSTIELIDNILQKKVQNGMAIIRPPGHHAMKSEYNGYCFFNNVAIAAQHAINVHDTKRILIVDFDVHHGQGTQQMFYNDPKVLYFSIHRYEHGTFWPNLRESDFDYVGEGPGLGYNFNVPLNKTGMTNEDYLAIWQQILLPVAIEYQPQLVIVSAGYDAAFGCPEFAPDLVIISAGYDSALGDEKGEMEITPAFYAHLLSPLLALAQGRVAVILEGGYCLESLAEGAAITLKTLLGDPCPLLEPLNEPCDSVQDSILNCINSHKAFWKCFKMFELYNLEDLNNVNPQPELHKVVQKFIGGDPKPETFPTRDCYPIQSDTILNRIADRLRTLKITTNLNAAPNRVCFVYDEEMTEHRNEYEEHPERPERIIKIMQLLVEYNLVDRMTKLPSRLATTEDLCLLHEWQYVEYIRKTSIKNKNLRKLGEKFDSVYLHPKTYDSARLAVGATLEVLNNVLNGSYQHGICVVRPPGHHAEADYAQGFCIFNNVALAAQEAIKNHGLKRVLIVDWDVHHGNGTQRMFESSSKVMYISVHRYDNGIFFPKSKDGDANAVGSGRGKGYTVNIPWNKQKMGDIEYITAFQRIIMPIAYEFNPELVLVSAGFDAAVEDPIGHYNVTPEAYGYFTHWLSSLANGKIILCLEGGYNVNSISHSMAMCTKALLGDPLPMLQISDKKPNASSIETIQKVLSIQNKYWSSLKFNKKLPDFLVDATCSEDKLSKVFGGMQLSDKPSQETKKELNNREQFDRDNAASSSEGAAGPSKKPETGEKQSLLDYLKDAKGYAIVPLKTCPHLSSLSDENTPKSIDVKSPCLTCQSTLENWMCLLCNKVYCGRYIEEHMMMHHLDTEHSLTLSFSDLSVWCYRCDAYVDNQILFKYKNMAHLNKFGVEMSWSYDDDFKIEMGGHSSSSDE